MTGNPFGFEFGMSTQQLQRRTELMQEFLLKQSRFSGNQLRRIEALEHNFGRMLLVLHSLYETAVRNGAVTAEQFAAVYRELDLRDGKVDGRLDPSAVPGMQVDESPPDMHEFFALLNVRPELETPENPLDFLKELEQRGDLAQNADTGQSFGTESRE